MSIIEYRQQVIDKLKVSFPVLKQIEAHPGKFTLEDFERLSQKSPAAYVAVLGAPAKERLATGDVLFDIHIAVFIASVGTKAANADVQGWQIAEAIAALAQWNYFNTKNFPADQIEIENLWSTTQERNQIAIMGVAWVSQLKIGTDYAEQLMQVQQGGAFVFPSKPVVTGSVFGNADDDPVVIEP
jgi:phage gp37-like protein